MTFDIQKFEGYGELARAEKVARRRANILQSTFVVLRRLSDGKYIVASRVHPDTVLIQTFEPFGD